jgi:hypothetical protein
MLFHRNYLIYVFFSLSTMDEAAIKKPCTKWMCETLILAEKQKK